MSPSTRHVAYNYKKVRSDKEKAKTKMHTVDE